MASKQITERAILDALRQVKDPELNRDLVSLNMVRERQHQRRRSLAAHRPHDAGLPLRGAIEADVQQALKAVPA